MLHHADPVGEAQCHAQLHLVLRLVRPVASAALRLPVHRLGQRVVTGQLSDIIPDTVGVEEILRAELSRCRLVQQPEGHAGVDHRLPLHGIAVVIQRHVDVGEYLQIRQPVDPGAGLFLIGGQLLRLQAADVLALFKVERILLAAPPDRHIHIGGGILGGAGTKAVETQ